MGGAIGHNGEVRKTDRAARRNVVSIRLNGRSSLRPNLAGDLLPRSFCWLLLSVGCYMTYVCEVFAFVKCLSVARSNFVL